MNQVLDFFIDRPDSSLLYLGQYHPVWVGLSILIAIFSAYGYFRVVDIRAQSQVATVRLLWLLVGGLCMGVGVWSMHFIGMLAFRLPCASSFQLAPTMMSALPSVLAASVALPLLGRNRIKGSALVVAALILGSGIGVMHYSGMAAMQIEGYIRYDFVLFLESIAVAVLLAGLSVGLKYGLKSRFPASSPWPSLLGSIVLGLAVSAMHYTAMTASFFVKGELASNQRAAVDNTVLVWLVVAASGVLIVMTLVTTYLDKFQFKKLNRLYPVLAVLLLSWTAMAWMSSVYRQQEQARENNRVVFQSAQDEAQNLAKQIEAELKRGSMVTQLLTQSRWIQRALEQGLHPSSASSVRNRAVQPRAAQSDEFKSLNHFLRKSSLDYQADSITVKNDVGDAVAASNFDQANSPIGNNYSDRAYFKRAQQGLSTQQLVMGRVSKQLGWVEIMPLQVESRFSGVLVFTRLASHLVAQTQLQNAFITDATGILLRAPDAIANSANSLKSADIGLIRHLGAVQPQAAEATRLVFKPWNSRIEPLAQTLAGVDQPFLLASQPVADFPLSVHVARNFQDPAGMTLARYSEFILLSAVGNTLILGVIGFFIYLRQASQADVNLRISAAAFESHEPMMITDASGTVLQVNPSYSQLTGYSAEELLGKPTFGLHGIDTPLNFFSTLWEQLGSIGKWDGEVQQRRKNGETYSANMIVSAVKDGKGVTTHHVLAQTDITQRIQAEQAIQQLAYFDHLTGLPNRKMLMDRLDQALARSERNQRAGALMFIDLNNFKNINDTMGHDVGDELLKVVADLLQTSVRTSDTVARFGGDEFIILLENLSEETESRQEELEAFGRKINNALEQHQGVGTNLTPISASIGVSVFLGQSGGAFDLLKHADLAMYQAKNLGSKQLIFFAPEMQFVLSQRVQLEMDLRQALANGQFLLHYQPVVNAQGCVTDMEALLRWNHPQRGLVLPGDFIHIAEESRLIISIGDWVLQEVGKLLQSWEKSPIMSGLNISVNISPVQFHQDNFVSRVQAMLQRTSANPNRLKLELTETLLINNADTSIEKMKQLRGNGIVFLLDDFGTGYSSLSYLKRLPLDTIKIDRSFVADMLSNGSDVAIIQAMIAMAQSLGLQVIAEGVETREQWVQLIGMGCHGFQGYYFGKSVGPDDVMQCLSEELIENH